jgi:hypothetical protein
MGTCACLPSLLTNLKAEKKDVLRPFFSAGQHGIGSTCQQTPQSCIGQNHEKQPKNRGFDQSGHPG